MKLKFVLASALLTLGLAAPAVAAPFGPQPIAYPNYRHAQWELIGTTNVSFRAERDTIYARGNDRHRQVMVCVYRNPVRIFDLDVKFQNGRSQDLAVRNVIGAGQCTRAIDLNGQRRNIRSVTLAYKSAGRVFSGPFGGPFGGRFGQAQVRVYAR